MTLVTTPEHPFAKVGVGWTRAADLTRGDRVETAGGGHATVVGVESREVQPTPVYNLTVSRTHAYFVGAQALLVHNTDCGGPSSREESHKRKREESPNQQHERFAARRAQHKARLMEAWRARERAREQARMLRDPFNDMPGRRNCTFCSLAGLSDVDRLSTLFREKNLDSSDPNKDLTGMEMRHLMLQWGLTSEKTPPPRIFPELHSDMEQAQAKVRQDVQYGRPRPRFPFQEQAKKLIETSRANTFAVGYQYFQNGEFHGHALLAVKRDDGSIVYVDLQAVPPSIRDDLDPFYSTVWVIPTDVDWRSNRQLSNAVENGVHAPLRPGEASN